MLVCVLFGTFWYFRYPKLWHIYNLLWHNQLHGSIWTAQCFPMPRLKCAAEKGSWAEHSGDVAFVEKHWTILGTNSKPEIELHGDLHNWNSLLTNLWLVVGLNHPPTAKLSSPRTFAMPRSDTPKTTTCFVVLALLPPWPQQPGQQRSQGSR